MSAATFAKPRSLSVAKVLLVCAVVGIGSGVVVAEVRRSPAFELGAPASVEVGPGDVIEVAESAEADDVMAAAVETLEGVAPYPNAAPRKLTGKSAVAAMPLNVSWFSTTDSAQAVLSFYEARARADDRIVVSHRFSDTVGYVAWATASDAPLQMISVVGKANETLVFLSRSEPRRAFEAPSGGAPGVLLPPTVEAPLTVSMGEFGGQRNATYAVAQRTTLEQARQFFETEWPKSGWRVSREADDTMFASRGRSTMVVHLTAEQGDTRIFLSETTE